MDEAEECGLVPRLRGLESEAWEVLCREYSRALLHFVMAYTGQGADRAEEIVQMTLVRCVRSIGSFEPRRGRLLPWLKAIARNEAHRCLRAGAGGLGRTDGVSFSAADRRQLDAIDSEPLPEELLAREETRAIVSEGLAALSRRHREALVWRYLEGRSVTETAERLGVTVKAAESVLMRAKAALREALGQRDGAMGRGTSD